MSPDDDMSFVFISLKLQDGCDRPRWPGAQMHPWPEGVGVSSSGRAQT